MKAITKTRFCPSPTGLLHLGNARTALFNALLAQHNDSTFLLRIEDTDDNRSQEKYVHALMHDLRWLGIRWQEGPEIGGKFGSYWQSERTSIYARYYKKLLDTNLAYPCFCSEEQLKLARKIQRSRGQAPRYPGTCSSLHKEQIAAKLAQGIKPSLRFRVPKNVSITFDDLVKGKQIFNSNDIGDFIIRRSNNSPSFMFANAIDDSLMQVTHILRGEDHLTNTPRQLMILQALKMPIPQYGHISLIIGNDNSPLSKRHGSKSLEALHHDGWLALGVINYLARVGHYYTDNNLMHFTELAKKFALKHLSHSPATFDATQMLYWQKLAIAHLNHHDFWQWLTTHSDDLHVISTEQRDAFISAVKPNTVFPQDALHWATIFFVDDLALNNIAQAAIKAAGKTFFNAALAANTDDIKAIAEHVKRTCQITGKALFMPLRFALTGEQHGPELVAIGELLGTKRIQQRLRQALHLCHA